MKVNIKKIKFYILLFMIVVSLSLYLFANELGINQSLVAGELENSPASILVYILWIILANLTTLPVTFILIPGIFLFSFKYVILFSYIGIIFGASITYYLSMYLGKDFVDDYTSVNGTKIRILKEMVNKNPFQILIVLNCFYFFPSTLSYVAAGVTKTNFWKFISAVIIGNFLNFFFLGVLILGIYEGNNYYIYTSLTALILVSLAPLIIYRKYIKEIIIVTFSKEAYKKFEQYERFIKK